MISLIGLPTGNCDFSRNRGVTLIEAMLCVVLLAICLVPVMQVLLNSLRSTEEMTHYAQAVLAGESALLSLSQDKEFLKSSLYEYDGKKVVLQALADREGEEQTPSAFQLQSADVSVLWRAKNKERSVVFKTLLLAETKSSAGANTK